MGHTVAPTPRLAALRHRDFRLLWASELFAIGSAQMQLIAVNWHIYELLKTETLTVSLFGQPVTLDTRALGLGALGLVRVLPIIAFALLGGTLADLRDRRTLMLWTRAAAAILAGVLALVTLSGSATLPLIYLLTAAGAAASAFDEPARQALVPNLVPRDHLTNAVSLVTLNWHIGSIVGPAVTGVLIRYLDIGAVYALNVIGFLIAIATLASIHHRGRAAAPVGGLGWQTVVDGIRFTYRSRLIWSTMLLDFFATFLASSRTMLPILADEFLGVGVEGYGVLATAQPIGALLAGLVVSVRRDIYHQGAVLLVSVAVYGVATALFGLSTVFALSYLLFALTGAGDTVSTVIRGTVRQAMTPDALRGRMVGVNMIFFMGGPQLGELRAGLIAMLSSAPAAIFSGGVLTVLLTGWIAWRYPSLRRHTSAAYVEPPAA